MARKKAEKQTSKPTESQGGSSGFFDYFRFGESYTSLILGMIVVILAVILAMALVRSRNFSGIISPKHPKQDISSISTGPSQKTKQVAEISPTVQPTQSPKQVTPTVQIVQTTQKPKLSKNNYRVQNGDTLWSIAEQTYKSGYNWVDIAKANNLTTPDQINAGTVLTLPSVAPKLATINGSQSQTGKIIGQNAITGNTYTVQHGDCLWTIAVRAYGSGFRWPLIAQTNNIRSPNLIYSGTVLRLPRT